MTLPIVVDIETVPTDAALREPYPRAERSHPANYKDPEKIAAWYERDEADWKVARVKECSLNPRLGRVLCIAYNLPCSDGPVNCLDLARTEQDEADVLRKFWEKVATSEGRVATFNGRGFDLQFVVLRSLARNVNPTLPPDRIAAWFRRYTHTPHCDVREALTFWDSYGSGKLADWCQFLGVAYNNGHTGADIYDLYRAQDFEAIAVECLDDVRATRELLTRIAPTFCSEAA